MVDEEKMAMEITNGLDTMVYDGEGSCVNIYDNIERAVLVGIRAGKPKWHDLRKDPNDLPDGGRQVIVADKSRNGYSLACFCRSGKSGFWRYERFISHIEDNYVLAWCDFLGFEEK